MKVNEAFSLGAFSWSGTLSFTPVLKKKIDGALCDESIKDRFITLLPPRSGTPWDSICPSPKYPMSTEWRNGIGQLAVQFVDLYKEMTCKTPIFLFYS